MNLLSLAVLIWACTLRFTFGRDNKGTVSSACCCVLGTQDADLGVQHALRLASARNIRGYLGRAVWCHQVPTIQLQAINGISCDACQQVCIPASLCAV
jgi:hypothetical protein